MAIKLKRNLLARLKEKGYSTYTLRKEKLLSESAIQKMRNNDLLSWSDLNTVCELLDCQPGDLIEYIPDEVNYRIIELTEQEEEELTEYYEDQWRSPVSEEIFEEYEDNIEEEIDNIVIPDIEDEEFATMLSEVYDDNFGHILQMNDDTWDEIDEKYGYPYADQIKEFYQSYINEFNEYLETEHKKYINRSVKNDLKEAKERIENEAYSEYFPDDDTDNEE